YKIGSPVIIRQEPMEAGPDLYALGEVLTKTLRTVTVKQGDVVLKFSRYGEEAGVPAHENYRQSLLPIDDPIGVAALRENAARVHLQTLRMVMETFQETRSPEDALAVILQASRWLDLAIKE